MSPYLKPLLRPLGQMRVVTRKTGEFLDNDGAYDRKKPLPNP